MTILLLPVLALIFMMGWILYILGEPQTSTKKVPHKNVKATKKEHELETGLTAELTEEPLVAE
jgi:hypothetical protein